jgi:hypothetical protein
MFNILFKGYYNPLQATVYHIHKHFPNHMLVIYDLGLTADMHHMVCSIYLRFYLKKKTRTN